MSEMGIKAVELVRRIRDEQYELLKNKTNEELKAFFHRESTAVNARVKQLF